MIHLCAYFVSFNKFKNQTNLIVKSKSPTKPSSKRYPNKLFIDYKKADLVQLYFLYSW